MNTPSPNQLESDWARLGVMFSIAPAVDVPDIERLLIRTAQQAPEHARLVPLTVTWLVLYGDAIARHRLRHLAVTELSHRHRAILGFVIETAIHHGASARLREVLNVCTPSLDPGPLSTLFRADEALLQIAESQASALSKKWGCWTPEITLKHDAVRPVSWVQRANPEFRDRLVRRGDLRCSIVTVLRHDAHGQARSEAAIARLCGASRAGLRKALDALVREGEVERLPRLPRSRDQGIRLISPKAITHDEIVNHA